MSGADAAPDPDAVPEGAPRSPRRGMCAAVLALEGITVALATPVMIAVEDVDTGLALASGLGVAALCLLLCGMLRAEWAYGAGFLLQAAAIALGFLVTTMFVLGGIFALLWGTAYGLGRKIERERSEAYRAWREQGGTA